MTADSELFSDAMPLEFELIPELALRNESAEFVLGMPLCHAISVLQRLNRQIRNVELVYCQQEPLSRDIVINLTNDGIRLVFDARCQRLKLIEVYDLRNIVLRYGETEFSSPGQRATVARVEQCFGATHPGVYDKEQRIYLLSWRGLSFCFPFESAVQPGFAHGLSCLQFPDGSSPTVAKINVYAGPSLAESTIPDAPELCYSGNCLLNDVQVVSTSQGGITGLVVDLTAQTFARSGDAKVHKFHRRINFGDTQQQVQSRLGCPSRVFFKSEDKMRIHRPSGDRQRVTRQVDYFFNYFTLGLDLLFDGQNHQLKKIILHTNYPGHFDFGIYHRCNFELRLKEEEQRYDFATAAAANKKQRPPRTLTINAFTKWEEISSRICESESQMQCQPVVLNRTSTAGGDNPFGSTFCYGYKDIIVEVMANGHIARLTLFDESRCT